MTGIAAIHHPLRHVDAGPGNGGLSVQIGDFIHRAAVNAHPHRKFRMLFERFGNLERAQRRFFRRCDERPAPSLSPVGSRTKLFVGPIRALASLRARFV